MLSFNRLESLRRRLITNDAIRENKLKDDEIRVLRIEVGQLAIAAEEFRFEHTI